MPLAGTDHGGIAADLLLAVGLHVRAHALGRVFTAETGFLLSRPDQPDTVLGADVAFVRAQRVLHRSRADRHGFWRLAPDLVAEVASPDQYRPEMAAKAQIWLTAGAHLVWVVWPGTESVDVWRGIAAAPVATINADGALDGFDVLPGFHYPLAELFG